MSSARRSTTTTFAGKPGEGAFEVRRAAGEVDTPVPARGLRRGMARLANRLVGHAARADHGEVAVTGLVMAVGEERLAHGMRVDVQETLQPSERIPKVATGRIVDRVRLRRDARARRPAVGLVRVTRRKPPASGPSAARWPDVISHSHRTNSTISRRPPARCSRRPRRRGQQIREGVGAAHDHVDAVRRGIGVTRLDRRRVDVGAADRREAELGRCDREHPRAAADVEERAARGSSRRLRQRRVVG